MADYVRVCTTFDENGVCTEEVWRNAADVLTIPEFQWDHVPEIFAMGLLVWAVGVSVGLIVNVVRQSRKV